MQKKYRPGVTFLFFSLMVASLLAQIKVKRNYTLEDGLPQSQVRAIYEDDDGYLWIGTMGGLSRWDGINFKNYFQKDGLPSSIVYDIRKLKNGKIYIATHAGLAAILGDSIVVPSFDHHPVAFPVSVLREGNNGELVLGTLGQGVYVISPDSVRIFSRENGLSNNFVRDIAVGENDTLYVATRSGFNIIDGNSVRAFNTENGLWNNYVHTVLTGENKEVYIGTLTGINIYKNGRIEKKFKTVDAYFTRMFKLIKDNSGNFYCGNWGSGIIKISQLGEVEKINISNGLISNNPYTLTVSSSGLVMAGLDGGISILNPHGIYWFGKEQGLQDPRIWKILELQPGRFVFSTSKGFYELQNDTIRKLSDSKMVRGGNVYAMVKLSDGQILIGGSTGLWKWKPDRNHFSRPFDALNEAVILDMKADFENNIWVASYGPGLWKFDGNQWLNINKKLILPTNRFFSVTSVDKNSVWCGSDGDGIIIIHHDQVQIINEDNGLANNTIYCISAMKDKSIYVGHDKGFSIIRGDSIRNFDHVGNQSFNSVFGILEDDKNNLVFLGTERGIVVVDRKDSPWSAVRLSSSDGLNSDELNQGAYYHAADGTQLWGSIRGINVIPQTAVVHHSMPPKIHVTAVDLFDKIIPLKTEYKLNHDQNYLRIHFIGIDFGNPEEVMYEYQMENVDPKPIRSSLREVQYTNLQPGTYSFHVRAVNKWGDWSSPAKIKFTVYPAWYETWWAYAAYVILVLLSIAGIIKIQTGRIKEKEYVKRTELKARAAEAEKKIVEAESQRKSEELIRAREIQEMMLPETVPSLSFLDISYSMETAREISGNYYDFFLRDEASVYIMVGGASGRGMPAGMMVALTKSALKTMGARPTQLILKRLNYVLKDIIPEKLNMSLTLGLFTEDGVELAMAAMPPVLKYSAENNSIQEIAMASLPLGFMETADYKNIKIEMASGDVLIMFTNGLPAVANENNENLGYDSIKQVLKSSAHMDAEGITQKLNALANGFRQGNSLTDDITIVTVKYV